MKEQIFEEETIDKLIRYKEIAEPLLMEFISGWPRPNGNVYEYITAILEDIEGINVTDIHEHDGGSLGKYWYFDESKGVELFFNKNLSTESKPQVGMHEVSEVVTRHRLGELHGREIIEGNFGKSIEEVVYDYIAAKFLYPEPIPLKNIPDKIIYNLPGFKMTNSILDQLIINQEICDTIQKAKNPDDISQITVSMQILGAPEPYISNFVILNTDANKRMKNIKNQVGIMCVNFEKLKSISGLIMFISNYVAFSSLPPNLKCSMLNSSKFDCKIFVTGDYWKATPEQEIHMESLRHSMADGSYDMNREFTERRSTFTVRGSMFVLIRCFTPWQLEVIEKEPPFGAGGGGSIGSIGGIERYIEYAGARNSFEANKFFM